MSLTYFKSITSAGVLLMASNTAFSEPVEGGGRYLEKPGTGKQEIVSVAKPVVYSDPMASVEKSMEIAKKAGGIPMDPALKDINLPGLKKDDPTLRPWVLHTRNGVNEVVKLSSSYLNRIVTPFKKPLIVEMSKSTSKIVGSDVYFLPEGNKPIGLFIIDSENKNQSISLTVTPVSNIPGQNLMVKIEDLKVAEDLIGPNSKTKSGIPIKDSDYVSFLRNILASAARGKIHGFSAVPLEGGVAQIGDLIVKPDFVFSGSSLDVYRYKIENQSEKTIDLSETAFYRKGVRAVSFFPLQSLEVNESSYVFIVADKSPAGDMPNVE